MSHPSSETLMEYGAGALHAGAALVVACHVETCARCRQEVALISSVGGALLQAAVPASLSDGALERALSQLDDKLDTPRAAASLPRYLQGHAMPKVLEGQRFGFRRFVTPNIWFAPLKLDERSETRTYLVYGAEKTTLAQHTHYGREFTTVLWGAFSDVDGVFNAGDFAETDESVEHAPLSISQGGCLCIISSDGPMRLVGQIARVIQSVTGTLY
jgi:putative transcriptional regulator